MSRSEPRVRQRAVREDHLRNHERLLRAASELFDEDGLDVPLSRIGARAGVSHSGLFRHFSGRDQVVSEVYERTAARFSERLSVALARVRDLPAEARVEAVFVTTAELIAEHPGAVAVISAGLRLRPGSLVDAGLSEEFGALVRDAQAEGVLAADLSGQDLIQAALVAGSAMVPSSLSYPMRHRIAVVLRRGLRPEAQATEPMPPVPDGVETPSA